MKTDGIPAIITGGASGLGEATARALATAGAKVGIVDIDEPRARALAGEIGGVAIGCDVSDAASAERALADIRQAHGSARILVCCAGIAPAEKIIGRDGPMDLASFRRVIEINLVGTFNFMRLVAAESASLSPLTDGERGVIILTASIAAYEGQIGQTAYAASKGGVVGLTLTAARELASTGIRVCSIAPGLFETPMLHGVPPAVQQSLAKVIPFPPRLGVPSEYAKLALAIIDNPMMNGETVRLDGALRMAPR